MDATSESVYSSEVSATPTAQQQSTIYVADIFMKAKKAGKNYFAQAVITIVDGSGNPVEGAIVYGDWSDAVSGSVVSNQTAGDGAVTVDSPKTTVGGTFVFTITDVVLTGYTYNPGLNVETSDSITYP